MTDHDRFDRLFEKGLSEYTNVAPREGLEQRLLARLARPEPERRWNWRWLWAVPALATVLIATLFSARPAAKHDTTVTKVSSRVMSEPVEPKAANVVRPTPRPQTAIVYPRPRVQVTSTVVRKQTVTPQPRLSTFPSPDENQQQARLLLRFVTSTPSEAVQVASEQEEFQKLAEASISQDSEDRSER